MAETCPICGKSSGEGRTRPFCSVRCANIDLGRWFGSVYAVPARDDDELDEDPGGADRG